MNEDYLKTINKLQLTSVMNKTKWQKLANAIIELQDFDPLIKVKYLNDNHEYGYSCLNWEYVKQEDSKYIQWLNIDPVKKVYVGQLIPHKEIPFHERIVKILQDNNIPYSIEDGMYRVWGYLEPSQSPDFV